MENDLMKASNFFESISTYQVKIRRILDQANERQLLSEGENQHSLTFTGLKVIDSKASMSCVASKA